MLTSDSLAATALSQAAGPQAAVQAVAAHMHILHPLHTGHAMMMITYE